MAYVDLLEINFFFLDQDLVWESIPVFGISGSGLTAKVV